MCLHMNHVSTYVCMCSWLTCVRDSQHSSFINESRRMGFMSLVVSHVITWLMNYEMSTRWVTSYVIHESCLVVTMSYISHIRITRDESHITRTHHTWCVTSHVCVIYDHEPVREWWVVYHTYIAVMSRISHIHITHDVSRRVWFVITYETWIISWETCLICESWVMCVWLINTRHESWIPWLTRKRW